MIFSMGVMLISPLSLGIFRYTRPVFRLGHKVYATEALSIAKQEGAKVYVVSKQGETTIMSWESPELARNALLRALNGPSSTSGP